MHHLCNCKKKLNLISKFPRKSINDFLQLIGGSRIKNLKQKNNIFFIECRLDLKILKSKKKFFFLILAAFFGARGARIKIKN